MCNLMLPDLIGSLAAAHILGVSVPTINRMARDGALPYSVKMPGVTGAYLFERSVVEARRDETAAA